MLERHHHELLNFLTRQVNDRDAAEDLAQEAFARALTLSRSGEAVHDPRALLYRIARNLVIDRHRRQEVRRHDDLDAMHEGEQPAAPAHLEPEQAVASLQAVRAYAAAIEALPPRSREAFVLHIFEDLPHAEIARRMGVSVSMVEKHVIRGLLVCRQCEARLKDGVDAT